MQIYSRIDYNYCNIMCENFNKFKSILVVWYTLKKQQKILKNPFVLKRIGHWLSKKFTKHSNVFPIIK